VEITGSWEYGLRGEMGYRVLGCPQCGGITKQMQMHLNRGARARTRAEAERLNAEDETALREAVRSWRAALPEPEPAAAGQVAD
jgi:hypothetical protein